MEIGNGNLVTSFFNSKCSFQSITLISSIYKHSHTIFLKLNEVIPARYIINYTGILFFFFFGNFYCVLLSRDLGNGTPHGMAQTIAHS